jgi:hypothetical protein
MTIDSHRLAGRMRGSRMSPLLACILTILLLAGCAPSAHPAVVGERGNSSPRAGVPSWCAPSTQPVPRYTSVAPILAAHCFSCHQADPDALDAWDGSTPYPFRTNRPQRVLWRMRERFEKNDFPEAAKRGLTEHDRCVMLEWIAAGALDDRGVAPPWSVAPPI